MPVPKLPKKGVVPVVVPVAPELRYDVAGAEEFEQLAEDYYAKVFYTNIVSAARVFFPVGEMVLDLGCGPGLVAERLIDEGYGVTLFDQNQEFLSKAMQRCPDALAQRGNMLYTTLPRAENVLWANTTGYFADEELIAMLHRLPGKRLIANFFCAEDQVTPSALCQGVMDDNTWVYKLGEVLLHLRATSEQVIKKALASAGYKVEAEFIYFDFKTERLILAERR